MPIDAQGATSCLVGQVGGAEEFCHLVLGGKYVWNELFESWFFFFNCLMNWVSCRVSGWTTDCYSSTSGGSHTAVGGTIAVRSCTENCDREIPGQD
jgi:hypothetical protein